MSGKYMNTKRIIIPTVTLALIGSMLFGVAVCTKQELFDIMQNTEAVELEISVPNTETISEDIASQLESLPWIQLSSLETHPELRAAFEEYLGITGTTGNKEGHLYYNPSTSEKEQNVTLYMALQNPEFKNIFALEAPMTKFGEIAAEHYTDVEPDDLLAPYATINAYFELLPDTEAGTFNGDSSISRAQAMTMVMRATTSVSESQEPETDADFTAKVGYNIYTDFAAPMNQYSYLNTENGLTESNFNTAMSKGEYICLVSNYIHEDYLKGLERYGYLDLYADTSSVEISTVSDAGNISLAEAIADAAQGVPSDMYETFKTAIKNGYITEAELEDWDSAITKAEAINYFISMVYNYTLQSGDGITSDFKSENNDIIENETQVDTETTDNSLIDDSESDSTLTSDKSNENDVAEPADKDKTDDKQDDTNKDKDKDTSSNSKPSDKNDKDTTSSGSNNSSSSNSSTSNKTEKPVQDGHESKEIMDSKWGEINGAWDAEHQWTMYARSQGADSTSGWCWIYENGSAAGNQPTYAVYMKEDDPLYGTVYHVGDYLPSGTRLCGTGEEYKAMLEQDIVDGAIESGLDVYEGDDGRTHIVIPEDWLN